MAGARVRAAALRPAGPGHAGEEPRVEQDADRRTPMIPVSRRRLVVLYAIVAVMLATLGGRLWYLQVMNGTEYKTLAMANQTRTVVVPAVRGQIVDDAGRKLVTNQTSL